MGEEPEEEPAPAPVIPFPTEGLVGLAADFAQLHAENLEAPAEAFYLSYLTMLGAAISRHARLATSLPVQPRLYTVLLGATHLFAIHLPIREISDCQIKLFHLSYFWWYLMRKTELYFAVQ